MYARAGRKARIAEVSGLQPICSVLQGGRPIVNTSTAPAPDGAQTALRRIVMSEQTTTQDVQTQNIALYRRFADGLDSAHLDIIDEVLAADIQLPTIADLADPTRAGLKQANVGLRVSFPDLHGTIEQIFAFGDWVAARITWTGTNTGEFMGNPPTGKTISITELEIVRYEDGLIVDLRQVADVASLMAQLEGE
jgi:predicted ester cyclase